MLRKGLLGAVLLGSSLVLGACGGGGADAGAGAGGASTTVVGLDTMKFNPEAVTVKAGTAVKINFRNGGMIVHDLITEGGVQNVKLIAVGAGKSQEGTFMANKPGTYAIVCTQPGHKEAGMVGKIVVE